MKIERLIAAISEYEGWHPVGSTTSPAGSRSYRHHNPGNLRASPFAYTIVEGYAVFKNDEIGRLALHYDILCKATGKTTTGLGPNSTLKDLIYKYAPASDNNLPERYLDFVCKNTGLSPTLTLKELFA